jgi:hypothetical protein
MSRETKRKDTPSMTRNRADGLLQFIRVQRFAEIEASGPSLEDFESFGAGEWHGGVLARRSDF